VLRRLGIAALLAASATLGAATAPAAETGPRLAILEAGRGSATSDLATLDPSGRERRKLATVPQGAAESWEQPTWSPDGGQLAFSARSGRSRRIFLVSAEGDRPRPVAGTEGGFLPVLSGDGRVLAFSRVTRRGRERYPWGVTWRLESTTVWVVDLQTGERRRLTALRDGLDHLASSFSPDGSSLLVTRSDVERSGAPELVVLRFDGGTSRLLVGEGSFGTYSPDGSRIALFRYEEHRLRVKRGGPPGPRRVRVRFESESDLYVVDADGSHLRQLTDTPGKEELSASWDPSGERIAFARFPRGRFAAPSSIVQINADGSCEAEIVSARGVTFYGPAWQPGPGRGAGRIAC
jgi:Tol biopolymer transport system component